MARPISPEHPAARRLRRGRRRAAGPLPLLLFRSLRPEQWTKNLIVFAGLIFGLELFDRHGRRRGRCGLRRLLRAVRCRLHRQRHHGPRGRPAAPAEGAPPDRLGRAVARRWPGGAAAVLAAGGARGRVRARRPVRRRRARVPAAAVAYSGPLKHIVILDVLTIAIGFVLRAVGRGGRRSACRSATGCSWTRSCWRSSWRSASAATNWCCSPTGPPNTGRSSASTARTCSTR